MAGRERSLVVPALLAALVALWAADRSVLQAKRESTARQPEAVPMRVGAWQATPVPVRPEDAALLPRAAILIRRYRLAGEPDSHAVDLATVSTRDLSAFHNPDSCYRSQGWAIVTKEPYRIPLGAGQEPVAVERLIVEKNGFRMQALYWYAIRSGPDGSLSHAHATRAGVLLSTLRVGGAQPAQFFRVTTLAADGEEESLQRCSRFAAALVAAVEQAAPVRPAGGPRAALPGK